MRGNAVANDRRERVANKDNLAGLGRERDASGAQHLGDLVDNLGLEGLLGENNRVGSAAVAGAQVVDGEHGVALRRGIGDPVVLAGAVRVAGQAEPVALGLGLVFDPR